MASRGICLKSAAISAGICLVSSCGSTVGTTNGPDPATLAGSACAGLVAAVPTPYWNQDLPEARLQKIAARKPKYVDSDVSIAEAAANWAGASGDTRYQELASTFASFGSNFDGWAQAVKTVDRRTMASYVVKKGADGTTSSPLTDSYTAAISACQSVAVAFASPPSPGARSTGA